MNGEGNTPNYAQIVDESLENLCGDAMLPDSDLKCKDYYKLVYKESNNMSHGCGYLYFANSGAWMDDNSVLVFLDNSVICLLKYLSMITATYSLKYAQLTNLALMLRSASGEMEALSESKLKILNKKRIEKKF